MLGSEWFDSALSTQHSAPLPHRFPLLDEGEQSFVRVVRLHQLLEIETLHGGEAVVGLADVALQATGLAEIGVVVADDSQGRGIGKLLSEAVKNDPELQKLYAELWASEHGHYRTFIQLAEEILPSRNVQKRWGEMLDAEAKIIQRQAGGPRMHSGSA